MSLRCKCPCENPTNCPLKSKTDNCALLNTPHIGQVFGLEPDYPYPPFHRKKLTNREVRDAVDKNELWFYIPPWQVPRVDFTCLKCPQLIMRNTPMKKIICMAKQNMTLNGPIGELKVSVPHFGKAKIKSSLKEAHKQCQSMKVSTESNERKFKNIKRNQKSKKL